MERPIKDFDGYTVDEFGNVYSYKTGKRITMKSWYHLNGYEEVKLRRDGRSWHKLVHRLVAEAFCENPHEYEYVNHKDRNIKNNHYSNLEWCSVQYNVNYSYLSGVKAVRNFKECLLIDGKTQELLGEFKSITAACRYANKFLGCSFTGMQKYLEGNGADGHYYYIKKLDEDVTTKCSNGVGATG